jgi:histidinol dehydrogenase
MILRRLDSADAGFDVALERLVNVDEREDPAIAVQVAGIISDVRARGDVALLELTARHDRHPATDMAQLQINASRLAAAWISLSQTQRDSLQLAHDRIRQYHLRQETPDILYTDEFGNRLGQRWTPIERVGVYVPGGRAAYPSSVLMTVVPARCAGVGEIVLVVPSPDGVLNPLVLGAAHLTGIERLFTIGGAQAIAALAFGTQTVPRVDKIVGPGNAWVAAAKRQVFGRVGIDSIAGPSEILVIADDSADPEWIAMDLFSQAEHDSVAQSLLVSADARLLDAVSEAINRLLPVRQRRQIIAESLEGRGALIKVRDLEDAARVANRIAPEHIQLMVRDPQKMLPQIRHAGAIFLGANAGEVLGDYIAGPSHVLPTYGTARFASPLSVYDFRKRSSVIELSDRGLAALVPSAVHIATSEGLEAHAAAAAIRLQG